MSEMERFFGDPNLAKLSWLLGSKTSPVRGAPGAAGGGPGGGAGLGASGGSYYARRR